MAAPVSNVDECTRWALAARDGDATAAAAFVRSTQAEVWRFTASLIEPAHADDLTQETYLRAFRALPAFEGRATARTWLLGIARRTCADHVRAAVRGRKLLTRAAALAPAGNEPADPGSALAATDLLGALAPARREAFVLTQLLGLSYEEAAAVMAVPIGTVRSRVARARSDLVTVARQALAG